MELLFATLGGVILGITARYTARHRDRHGAALVPAVGAASAAVIWVALTWAGLAWDGGWIWVATLAGSGVVSAVTANVLGRRRAAADERRYQRLLAEPLPRI